MTGFYSGQVLADPPCNEQMTRMKEMFNSDQAKLQSKLDSLTTAFDKKLKSDKIAQFTSLCNRYIKDNDALSKSKNAGENDPRKQKVDKSYNELYEFVIQYFRSNEFHNTLVKVAKGKEIEDPNRLTISFKVEVESNPGSSPIKQNLSQKWQVCHIPEPLFITISGPNLNATLKIQDPNTISQYLSTQLSPACRKGLPAASFLSGAVGEILQKDGPLRQAWISTNPRGVQSADSSLGSR
jgi:hypothetical protein